MADPNQDFVELRAHLADRDVPCPSCSYSLRALTTDRCPECNQQLVLAVRLAEPRLGIWIAGLVGPAMGLGFHGLLLGWAASKWFSNGFANPRPITAIPLMIGLAACLPLLLYWIVARRRVMRWSETARISAASVLWLCAILPAGWFFATVN
ncbi:MAG: hypothetical protein ACREJO_16035 [Phycisphaerales bacterium]